ncbi:MAG: hypothetical protein U0525_02970 [Patescibacteria group bacterium]
MLEKAFSDTITKAVSQSPELQYRLGLSMDILRKEGAIIQNDGSVIYNNITYKSLNDLPPELLKRIVATYDNDQGIKKLKGDPVIGIFVMVQVLWFFVWSFMTFAKYTNNAKGVTSSIFGLLAGQFSWKVMRLRQQMLPFKMIKLENDRVRFFVMSAECFFWTIVLNFLASNLFSKYSL